MRRRHNTTFMAWVRAMIASQDDHPLKFLLSPKGDRFLGRRHGSEFYPTVQAGHAISFHGGAPERLFVEDADFNQMSNWRGERQGYIFEKTGVNIHGVPVERSTAEQWERLGLLPTGTVGKCPIHMGWRP